MAIPGFAGSKPAMSRISRKSELSPSVTKSGGGIDLGKNDVDMGSKGKTSPSVTSGDIGVSTEITNIGGLTVTGGISADISPIGLGINYDPSQNSLGIAGGAEIPGGLLGASAGITVDLDTGEVIGGQIGGEALGLGVNISASKDGGLGVEFTVQIPFTPIELSVGFGYSPDETPTPTPTPTPLPYDPTTIPDIPSMPTFPTGNNCFCKVVVSVRSRYWSWQGDNTGARYQFGNNDEITSDVNASYDKDGILKGYISYYERYHHWNNTERNPGPDNRFFERTLTIPIPPDPYPNGVNSFQLIEIRRIGGDALEIKGSEQRIYNYIKGIYYQSKAFLIRPGSGVWDFYNEIAFKSASISLNLCIIPDEPSPPPPPFPNPPPRKRNKMDDCCKENLKFLRAIYKGLGIAKFPGQLPNTIVQEIPKEGEQPAEPPQVPIPDLVSLLNWQFERDDERWGQWEIQINIKDADLTKEGNQGKSVKFPNLAESVAEMEGQMLSIQANVEALVALSIRNLTESGMARQEAIKGYLASMAIAKYMAFPYKKFDVEIPSTYTPGATSIDKLIIESIVHAKGIEYEDKETQRDLLLDLLQAAAITRAVHWRQVNPKNDIKEQILSQLRGSVDLSEKITNVKAVAADGDTPPKKESWEDKLDQYENGFGFSTGIEDANTPYGRDREQRPRIRQIGDNIAQAGKDE